MMSTLNVPSVHDTGQRKSHALMSILQACENDESVDILVDKIVEIAEEVLDSERVLLFFVGTAPDLFALTCPSSPSTPLTLPLDRGIPGYVARTGRVHNTHHAASDPHHDPSIDALLGICTRSCLCIPIVNSAGSVYAVLQAINKRRPGQDDEEDEQRQQTGAGGGQRGQDRAAEERKEAAEEEDDEAEPVYTMEDEEIGVAFCVGVHSTLRRRLTEVVMWRSRRGGEGGDKGIQSMLEIYGNSAHTGGRSTGVSGGYGESRQSERVKRRSLGAAQFTTAVLHSIYHPPPHTLIPEPSQLLPSLSDGSSLVDSNNRRATWSRTMSTPFKGRRAPITHLDLSHTTDLSVIGLAAGAGAAAAHKQEGAAGDGGAGGGARQGVGSSAYTVLSHGAWQSPRGSRKGGAVPSHSMLALYNTLPTHNRTLNSSHPTGPPTLPPLTAHPSSYSHITHYTNSPLNRPRNSVVAAVDSVSTSASTLSPLLIPAALPPSPPRRPSTSTPADVPSHSSATTATSASSISLASKPSSPALRSSAEPGEVTVKSRAVFASSSRTSPAFRSSSPSHPSSSPLIASVTFSSLDSQQSSPASAPVAAPLSSYQSISAVAPSRTSSSPSRFAAPWAAFDSEREEDAQPQPQQPPQPQAGDGVTSTLSSTGSSPGFSSSQSGAAEALRSSFSLAGPALVVDGLTSTAALPSSTSVSAASSSKKSMSPEEADEFDHELRPSPSSPSKASPPTFTVSSSPLTGSPPSTSAMSSALGSAFLTSAALMSWPSLPSSSLPDLDTLTSLSFNPFDYSEDALLHCCLLMLHSLDLTRHFGLEQSTLQSFLLSVRSRYRHNPYHNWYHATSVMQFAYFTVRSTEAGEFLPKLDLLALLLAALCHDIDHPGTTNSFQVMAASPLALLYNDQAVLENHHAATTFTLLSHPSTSIFSPLHSSLQQTQVRALRKMMIASILATDMARHFDMCHELDSAEPECASINWHSEQDRQFILNLITHSSDLSGQITPLHIACEWEERVTREFIAQSELESSFGFPLTFHFKGLHNERTRLRNHINFLDFVMTPLWTGLVELFPNMRPCAENLVRNRKHFMDRMAEVRDVVEDRGEGEGHQNGAEGEDTERERGTPEEGVDAVDEREAMGEEERVVTIHEDRSRCASIDEETGEDFGLSHSGRGSASTNGHTPLHHTFASAESSPASLSASSSRNGSVSSLSRALSPASSPTLSGRGSLAPSAPISGPSSPLVRHSFLTPLAISINHVPEDGFGSMQSSATPSPSHSPFASTSPSPSVVSHPSHSSSSFASTAPTQLPHDASSASSSSASTRRHESIKDRRESRWGDQLITNQQQQQQPPLSPHLLSHSPASSTASLSPASPPLTGPLLSPFSVGPSMNGNGGGGGGGGGMGAGEVRKKMSIGERRVSVIQTLQATTATTSHAQPNGV